LPPPPPPVSGFHPYVLEITPLTVGPTDETTVSFQVIFSEAVANFNGADDVVITETGLSHTGVTITDIGPIDDQNRIYQVDVTGISGEGDMTLAVKSWVRNWSEKSLAGTFDEQNNFIITGPYPDQVRFGKYVVELSTATEVIETNDTVGYSTPPQSRSNFIDYPEDTTCCSGDPLDYCCNPTDWPLGFPNYTHYLSPPGWSDNGLGGDWVVGDAITFTIVSGSDTRSLLGNTVVSFTPTSVPVTRLEPLVEDCSTDPPTGPSWWCDSCIENAIVDFCGYLSTPDVIDPSDQSSVASTGEYWNVPALLWDAAIDGQLDDKIGTMAAKVKINVTPSGIIQKYADDVRFGVMGFRPKGEKSECGQYELFSDCVNADSTADGARVAVPAGQGSAHTVAVTQAINAYDGNTWTPLAESMYTAIGYYTQKDSMRLDSGDYAVNADAVANATWDPASGVAIAPGGIVNVDGVNYKTPGGGTPAPDATTPMDDADIIDWEIVADPIIAYCQRNFVLTITEGSSTADLNPSVETFAAENADADTDIDSSSGGCDKLKGSSYFDDIINYGWSGTDIYEYEPFVKEKNNIEVHIVDTRGAKTGTGECNPYTLLEHAAENTNRVDKNGDGIAEDTETALYSAASPRELWNAMDQVMRNIITQTSSGSAASVISASRSGEGALYQALFWPATLSGLAPPNPPFVDWLGEVHGFFVDGSGNLREDTDQDGILEDTDEIVVLYWDEAAELTQACNGEVVDGACVGTTKALSAVNYLWSTTDWLSNPAMDSNIEYNRTVDGTTGEFIFDPVTPKRYIFTWNDLDNDGAVDGSEIKQFQKYFDPESPLEPPFPSVTAANRAPLHIDFGVHPDGEDVNGDGLLTAVCEDADRDGILDVGEDLNANEILDIGEDRDCDGTLDNWAGVTNNIIDWVRGKDIYGMRKRELLYDIDKNPLNGKEQITWRLGDVVHSTPLSVASPAENYHQLYRDFSYAEFLVQYQNRRHVIYFGANDGMLHAVNGGFFKSFDNPSNPAAKISRFCRTEDCVVDPSTGAEQNTANAPVLGAELWAYVPYNIIPHLECLTDVTYDHKYFVDLRPRIFDVQIFNVDADHPNGWGTILVGGMRFGGSKVQPGSFDEDGNPRFDYNGDGVPDYDDNREFTSAYFILDITNPEKPPVLLAEFTRTLEDVDGDGTIEDLDGDGVIDESPHVDLGFTTNISTMVPMRSNEDSNGNGVFDSPALGEGEDLNCNNTFDQFSKWYLMLGSGPTEIDGTSSQFGSVSVVPLDRFVDDGSGSDPVLDMRIPAPDPTSTDNFRSFELPDDQSFTSDLITVDMETNKNYMADVVYFGSNAGDWTTGWDGKMLRMVVRKWQECNGNIVQVESEPKDWAALYEPDTTPFMPLIDVEQPITTSATVATDGRDFWVYFGTGRFFDIEDKYNVFSNSTQSFYGIREPASRVLDDLFYREPQPLDLSGNLTCQLSWAQVLNDRLATPTGGLQQDGATSLTERGGLGVMKVDDVIILSSRYIDQPGTLACVNDPDEMDPLYCLPAELKVKLDGNGDPMTDPVTGDDYTGSYQDLIEFMTGDYYNCNGTEFGYDGWYRDFQDPRERNLGQASLLGGLLSLTTYQPFSGDLCRSEGLGFLYGLYYQTGTPWFEDVFGLIDSDSDPRQANPVRMDLGKGLSTTPNIHVGREEGGKAFVQTSVGKIKEIPQPNLPSKHVKSGRIKWRDIEQ
jgi:type IV pilus assembly protein PilY1